MTKKDYELLAGVLARAEALIELAPDPSALTPMSVLNIVAVDLANTIQRDAPRFRVQTFMAACFPRRSDRLKESILARLNQEVSA